MSRTAVKGEGIPKPVGPYSPAIKTEDYVFCSGQIGLSPATGKLGTTIEEQTTQALLNLQSVLKAAGAFLSNAVKTTVFMADMSEFSRMNGEYAKFFPKDPPARSTIGATLPFGVKVEIELVARVGPRQS